MWVSEHAICRAKREDWRAFHHRAGPWTTWGKLFFNRLPTQCAPRLMDDIKARLRSPRKHQGVSLWRQTRARAYLHSLTSGRSCREQKFAMPMALQSPSW